MPNFTKEETAYIEALRNAVLSKPADYTYPKRGETETCDYVRDSAPSCLVGHGVINGGLMPMVKVVNYEGKGARAILEDVDEIGHDVVEASSLMQGHQDDGSTWEMAYGMFLGYLAAKGYVTFRYRINAELRARRGGTEV